MLRKSALTRLIVLLVLSACAAPTELPTATEEPVTAPTDPPATDTPIIIDATPTPISSYTPTTLPPYLEVTPTETYTWRSESPDGTWSALGFFRGPLTMEGRDDYRLLFQIYNAEEELAWTVYDEYVSAALGFGLPEVYRWAEDEGAVYITHHTLVDGCGVLADGNDLLRFDLENGQLETLFPGDARAIGLSPDNGTLAYIPWGPMQELILLELSNGEERSMALEGYADSAVAGAITWSLDGSALALTIAENPCVKDWQQTIIRLDAKTLIPETLFTSDGNTDPMLLTTAGWTDENTLLLEDYAGREWFFDLESAALAPVE